MQVNQNSNVPIYEQIYEQFLNYISKGILQTGDKLPSVRELSSTMHINPNTVVKAYRMLEEQKFIHSIPGKGSFVSEKQEDQTSVIMNTIHKDSEKLVIACKYIDMSYDELCQLLKKRWEE